jgi:hypothetical protein
MEEKMAHRLLACLASLPFLLMATNAKAVDTVAPAWNISAHGDGYPAPTFYSYTLPDNAPFRLLSFAYRETTWDLGSACAVGYEGSGSPVSFFGKFDGQTVGASGGVGSCPIEKWTTLTKPFGFSVLDEFVVEEIALSFFQLGYFAIAPVPEPETYLLLLGGLAALAIRRRALERAV